MLSELVTDDCGLVFGKLTQHCTCSSTPMWLVFGSKLVYLHVVVCLLSVPCVGGERVSVSWQLCMCKCKLPK